MGRIPVIDCPKCGTPGIRRVYLQNAAGSDRPRHESIKSWLYCEACDFMVHKPRPSDES